MMGEGLVGGSEGLIQGNLGFEILEEAIILFVITIIISNSTSITCIYHDCNYGYHGYHYH